MYNFRTIIFDLDGTLFKTETVFIEAMQQVCINRGIEAIEKGALLHFIGKPSSEVFKEIFGADISQEEIRRIRSEVNEVQDKLIETSAELYFGIRETIISLSHEGYNLCICTNGSKAYLNKILNRFNLAHYFHLKKSRIEGLDKYQLIKQIIEENATCSAIVVGDTLTDFEAAEQARCISIGVTYGYGNHECHHADFIANSSFDIAKIIKKINGLYRNMAEQIFIMKKSKSPLIVGINGVDTSGKSMLANELSRYLYKLGFKTQVISIDDFHNPSSIRSKDKNPITSYLNNAFDISKIEKELLEPISVDHKLCKQLHLLDLKTDAYTRTKEYNIDADTIVIFEGVLLFREPLNKYFDLRVFVDITFDEVLNRAVIRDKDLLGETVIEKYRNKYIPIQKQYLEAYSPASICDIVIDNNDFMEPVAQIKTVSRSEMPSRTTLVELCEDYSQDIVEMFKDEHTREMMGSINLPSISDYCNPNSIAYAIISNDLEFVGTVELFNISWKNRRGELSIAIKPQMRGKGYGIESINKMLEKAFLEQGINRVWLRVLENNTSAIKLYEKVGFSVEGICIGESLRNGEFRNQIQMSYLAKDWINGFIK